MKRIIFCFDGTWNKLHAADPTNVVLVAESIFPTTPGGVSQVIHYDDGVGTGGDDWKWKQLFEKATGGILGWGLLDNIREAYRFLIFNYDPGDEIYVFGFSRGAYTARSFIGLLRCVSIVRRRDAAQINGAVEFYRNRGTSDPTHRERLWKFRAAYAPHLIVTDDEEAWRTQNIPGHVAGALPRLTVRYAGLWDTVGALGIPESLPGAEKFNSRHQFHDPDLPGFVESGRHALALDERRRTFSPTIWKNVAERNAEKGFAEPAAPDAPIQQQWFPGTHGSIGGGGDVRGLSDAALAWVMTGARTQGLELDTSASSRVYDLQPDYRASLFNTASGPDLMTKFSPKKDRAGPASVDEVHVSARRRWWDTASEGSEAAAYRPKSLEKVAAELDILGVSRPSPFVGETLAIHIVDRNDALSRLARRYYGDAALYDVIFQANRDLLDDPDEIYPGMELIIPKLETLAVQPAADPPTATDEANP